MSQTAYISIGSNLGNPHQQVLAGLAKLGLIEATRVVVSSPWYLSLPMGPKDQPNYINGVAKIFTQLNPGQLLTALQKIEDTHGRVRSQRWGPRTLDLDILLYGCQVIDKEHLKIPHHGLKTRNFVLIPLADIAPKLVLPDGISLDSLLEVCSPEGIVPLASGDISDTIGQ
ncbi:MAG: 2-amino-4-hydroxy-6-hydroxymethyldihydropteridine diphosphokinase [Porticoccus sp.]|jgi:2-amino-4-hydroxy-6-hydroxymethyldihydropteridine diphosphokinase|uniref:2-amino-4-hydroxy-6- hydroxymethyldihydropteridine diphosphokinase n=1 Tax=Porticoccus sp. Uisw_050_02 TaxID=3230978 RepID=UPI003095C3A5|tara:strand:+ start:262 stop:774 length:513 start_codon:yes stop_codon:yes gene_type:complete